MIMIRPPHLILRHHRARGVPQDDHETLHLRQTGEQGRQMWEMKTREKERQEMPGNKPIRSLMIATRKEIAKPSI